MQDGEHDLDGRLLFLLVHLDRDATAVVDYPNTAVLADEHLDVVAVAGERLIDGVVDDLVNQVVQTARASRSDVHTWAACVRPRVPRGSGSGRRRSCRRGLCARERKAVGRVAGARGVQSLCSIFGQVVGDLDCSYLLWLPPLWWIVSFGGGFETGRPRRPLNSTKSDGNVRALTPRLGTVRCRTGVFCIPSRRYRAGRVLESISCRVSTRGRSVRRI